jgi:hypothetical protein
VYRIVKPERGLREVAVGPGRRSGVELRQTVPEMVHTVVVAVRLPVGL